MTNVLCMNDFQDLSQDEMMFVDGGVDWNEVGLAVSIGAGACIGAKIGSAGGPGWAAAGAIIGGAVGAILYTLND